MNFTLHIIATRVKSARSMKCVTDLGTCQPDFLRAGRPCKFKPTKSSGQNLLSYSTDFSHANHELLQLLLRGGMHKASHALRDHY
jgi:hypothetical protein